jgi:hypothetical protein
VSGLPVTTFMVNTGLSASRATSMNDGMFTKTVTVAQSIGASIAIARDWR